MASGQREVVWTLQGQRTLEEAVAYIAEDSLPSAQRLLERALEAGASLAMMSERGRIAPELENPKIREIFRSKVPVDLRSSPNQSGHSSLSSRCARFRDLATIDERTTGSLTSLAPTAGSSGEHKSAKSKFQDVRWADDFES